MKPNSIRGVRRRLLPDTAVTQLSRSGHIFLSRTRSFLSTHGVTIGAILLVLLLAWCTVAWSSTVRRIARYYTPIPDFDYWITAARLPYYKALDLRVFWQQHNEHRIFFQQIIFAADYILLHGRRLLPFALNFLCYFGSWILLTWAFWTARRVTLFLRATGVLLAGIVIGWQGSAVILADPFLLQWTLAEFTIILSLVFLCELKSTHKRSYLALAIISAVVATYSSGNGLMLWPVLLAAGFFLLLRPREMIVLACAAVITISGYFVGYQFLGTLSFANLLRHPIYLLKFVAAYLSMPFGVTGSARLSVCAGIINLGMAVLLFVVAARRRIVRSRTGIVLFGVYVVTVLSALLTAAGRMNVADSSFSIARQTRYLLGPEVAWSVLLMLSLWVSSQFRYRTLPYAIACLSAVLILESFPRLRPWLEERDQFFANLQLGALSADLNVFDPGVMLNLFPWDPGYVERCSVLLRENHLSVFYKGYSNWLGYPVSMFAARINANIHGEITYTYPVLGGIEVGGWADDSQASGGKGWILLSNENGRIVGFGRKLPAGLPQGFDNFRTPPSLGWVGFVNLSYPVKNVTAYLIEKRGLLALHESMPISPLQVIPAKDAGAQLPGIRWQMDPSWTPGEPAGSTPLGPAPATPIYNSWGGNDAKTGRLLSSSFAAPEDGCVVLAVSQGDHSGGLAAQIMDADTDQVLARIPFHDARKQWIFWRIPVAASAKNLRVAAEDNGKNFGEWMALGTPSACSKR